MKLKAKAEIKWYGFNDHVKGIRLMNELNATSQFSKYVIPSMLSMILTGFYGIVDGFFIGQVMGDNGLAAINIAWPLLSLISSVGIGIGTGGAIIMSIKKGSGDLKESKKVEGTTIVMLFIASIAATIIYLFFSPILLRVLGAEGILFEYGLSYMKVIAWGAFFQIMGAGLNPILKNLGKPIFAMIIMVIGMFVNIVLDWAALYVFDWGLGGVAFATCTGQAAVAVLAAFAVAKDKLNHRWYILNRTYTKEILKIGASPFGLTMAPGVVIIFTNLQSLNYGGTAGVAVYTVMSYAAYLVYSLMQGLADGVQPIISFCKGAADHESLNHVLKKAFGLAGAISLVLMIVIAITRYEFPIIYGVSHEVALASIPAMLALVLAVPFIAIARIMSAYFYAIDDGRNSSILVYADPFVFTPLFLLVLPIFFNIIGIWLAYPATQIAITILAVVLRKISNKDE
ncbi:MAG: MATE family efflux transporter [Aminipila sp.]